MIVLVCGGRDFNDWEFVYKSLDTLHKKYPIKMIIQGGARGADLLAKEWSDERGVHSAEVRALWDHKGKGAGYARNAAMLFLKPSVVVAFNGGVGTQMMVSLATKDENVKHVWDRRNK